MRRALLFAIGLAYFGVPLMPFYASTPFSIPDENVAITVDSMVTIGSGGTLDWWGRASIKRWIDDRLVMVYYRASGHATNDGAIYIRMSGDNGATWSDENEDLAGSPIALFPLNPTVASGQDAFEPKLHLAPNGDLILRTWRYNFPSENGGSYQWRSSDGGGSWASEGGPIQYEGLTYTQNVRTYATDGDFTFGSTIFAGARVYDDADQDPQSLVLTTSNDNGASWIRLSTVVAPWELGGHGTGEMGITYLGSGRILAVIRDMADIRHTYERRSLDMGASWGALTDITANVGVSGRQQIYHRAQLKGQANWWADPVLLMVGFEHEQPGSSLSRRNAVWVSRDFGDNWDGPFYLDAVSDDGGYGDIFYDAANDKWIVVSYRGTLMRADLKEYVLDIAGI
jgi:hypothetical protein